MKVVICNRTRVIETHTGVSDLDPDAVVLEEDTGLVLGAPDEHLSDRGDHIVRIMTDLHDYRAPEWGQIVVRRSAPGEPVVLAALVHDLDREPSVTPESVGLALRMLWRVCAQRQLRKLAMQPLGAMHGSFQIGEFRELLQRSLASDRPEVDTIWLLVK